jgi:hypothetical protein
VRSQTAASAVMSVRLPAWQNCILNARPRPLTTGTEGGADVAKCRRPLPAESQRILQAMTRDLRDRLRAFGWTHSALAERLRCDRSRVSHALAPSGEELPPRQLIQSIADALDVHAAEQGLSLPPLTGVTMRRWYEASRLRSSAMRRERQERRRAIAKEIEGAPPASMETHQDLLRALNGLITARFGSQRAMCRAWRLGRPAVSAAPGRPPLAEHRPAGRDPAGLRRVRH